MLFLTIPKLSITKSSPFRLIISCLALSLILSACSSVSSLVGGRYKYDHAQNFKRMQKYNFNTVPPQLESDPNFRFIRDSGAVLAIENAMAMKKIRKERNAVPDFWINFYFTGEQNITVGQLNKLYAYNLGLAWDDKYGTGQGTANTGYKFSRRTLIIDLISREHNRLIWRGSAPTGITSDDSESKKRDSLNKSVAVILDPFPPENNFSSLKQAVPE